MPERRDPRPLSPTLISPTSVQATALTATSKVLSGPRDSSPGPETTTGPAPFTLDVTTGQLAPPGLTPPSPSQACFSFYYCETPKNSLLQMRPHQAVTVSGPPLCFESVCLLCWNMSCDGEGADSVSWPPWLSPVQYTGVARSRHLIISTARLFRLMFCGHLDNHVP